MWIGTRPRGTDDAVYVLFSGQCVVWDNNIHSELWHLKDLLVWCAIWDTIKEFKHS